MFPGRNRKAVGLKQVVFLPKMAVKSSFFKKKIGTLNSVINFVEISVKFPLAADFCIHAAILLMNATQINILDAITNVKLGNSQYCDASKTYLSEIAFVFRHFMAGH